MLVTMLLVGCQSKHLCGFLKIEMQENPQGIATLIRAFVADYLRCS